jgi:spermidine/putrescine transport system permease protein
LGLTNESLDILYTPLATGIGLAYSFLPFMILPTYVALERIDKRLIEAAFDLGADRWRVLTRIVLPLAMPGILAGAILVFVPCLGAYVSPELLGGGKSMMIGNLVQSQFGASRNWPFGAALALVLVVVLLATLLLWRFVQRRLEYTP